VLSACVITSAQTVPDDHWVGTWASASVEADSNSNFHNVTLRQIAHTSYYFLTNVDVQRSDLLGAVVTLGASITGGYISTEDANHRWPDFLAARLANAGLKIGVLNQGISGNRLLTHGAGPSALTRFERDVLNQPGVRWVIYSDVPVNDLGSTKPQPRADQLIASIQKLIARSHEKHVQILCSTLTPYQGANYWTPEGEAAREQINAFIRGANSGCDAVIDQDLAIHDPGHPTRYFAGL
jgi:lysophospholipase L1-like esterase